MTSKVVKNDFGLRALLSLARNAWSQTMNTSFGGKRDFDAVFGYDKEVRPQMMRQLYIRGGIAGRIVKAFPDSVWSGPPALYGSPEFNTAWEALTSKFNVWDILHRAEILARLNAYSVIVVGLTGSNVMNDAGKRRTIDELLFLQPYGEISAPISTWETDVRSSRFRKPLIYNLTPENVGNIANGGVSSTSTTGPANSAMGIHYSRMVHITQEVLENEFFGIPALLPIWDWLMDLRKVVGSSAENFWLTANRGLHIDVDKDMDFSAEDAGNLAEEIDEYQHQLRRVIRTRGVKIDQLGTTVASPKDSANLLIQLISGSTGIPTRILLGAESGHLASTQDKGTWAERVEEYRRLVATPRTLAGFIRTMTNLGILPVSEVWSEWPDAYKQSPLERGQTSAQTARTATNLARAVKDNPTLLTESEIRRIIGLSTDGKALDPSADLEGESSMRQRVMAASNGVSEGANGGYNYMNNNQIVRVI